MSLPLPYSQSAGLPSGKKESRGPLRTSKTSNKLKVLPSTAPGLPQPITGSSASAQGASSETVSPTSSSSHASQPQASATLDRNRPSRRSGTFITAKPEGRQLDGHFADSPQLGRVEDEDDEEEETEDELEFYNPLAQIPAGSARRDALRLTKTEKAKLPRVTAYCTAAGFNLPALQAYLSSRPSSYRCHPRLFDTDCLHTSYLPPAPPAHSTSHVKSPPSRPASTYGAVPEADLLGLQAVPNSNSDRHLHAEGIDESEALLRTKRQHQIYERDHPNNPDHPNSHADSALAQARSQLIAAARRRHTGFAQRPSALASAGPRRRRSSRSSVQSADDSDREAEDDDEEWLPDLFVFEYGTVVIWGMTEREERRVLASLRKFEFERLAPEDVEMEDLNFYYSASYSRIYNDVITLRKGSSFMTKLSLSHALSQSVKISLFEELVSGTIEQTKDLPRSLSETGTIGMSRTEIMQKIGNLFILRINWGSSFLDVPEFFWSFPDLEPLYLAARNYLEINQRIELLNARVAVLQDMLQLLRDSMTSSHGERLEWIVILLIGVEIILGAATIVIDIMAGGG